MPLARLTATKVSRPTGTLLPRLRVHKYNYSPERYPERGIREVLFRDGHIGPVARMMILAVLCELFYLFTADGFVMSTRGVPPYRTL